MQAHLNQEQFRPVLLAAARLMRPSISLDVTLVPPSDAFVNLGPEDLKKFPGAKSVQVSRIGTRIVVDIVGADGKIQTKEYNAEEGQE